MDLPFLPFSRPSITDAEVAAVTDSLRSGWITTGPKAQALEEEFAALVGAKHAVALASATAGMHLVLLALGIGPGDEVITPSMTWVSTANMICLLGAKPVFVDVDRDTLMVGAEAVEEAITRRTKAIVPVHYAGAPCDLPALRAVAQRHGVALVEDAAHAVGTTCEGRPVGASGTAIFSFHAIKNLTSAEGGMVVTDDAAFADRIRRLKFHGLAADAFDRETMGRKPQAQVIEPGFKYNLSDLHAGLGLAQLHRITEINAARRRLAQRYLRQLTDSPVLPLRVPADPAVHAWHLFVLRIDPERCGLDREAFMDALKQRGIGTGIHFLATHLHPYYRKRWPDVSLPATEWNSARICSIPLFPDMTAEDVDRVIAAIADVVKRKP